MDFSQMPIPPYGGPEMPVDPAHNPGMLDPAHNPSLMDPAHNPSLMDPTQNPAMMDPAMINPYAPPVNII